MSAKEEVLKEIGGEVNVPLSQSNIDVKLLADVVKGPEAYGIDHVDYLVKLAGVANPRSALEQQVMMKEKFLAEASDDELREIYKGLRLGTVDEQELRLRVDDFMTEFRKRGLKRPDVTLTIGRSPVCDKGAVIRLSEDDDGFCVKPKQFTEIQTLAGNDVIIGGSDVPLPNTLYVHLGEDGEAEAEYAEYFHRKLMPFWLIEVLRAEIRDDPKTKEARAAIWEQMRASVAPEQREDERFKFVELDDAELKASVQKGVAMSNDHAEFRQRLLEAVEKAQKKSS